MSVSAAKKQSRTLHTGVVGNGKSLSSVILCTAEELLELTLEPGSEEGLGT